MLAFTGLRLTGFKSFVESAELEIQPGMTGVVGPNGCGKSNLIEALRWVMGESSARQMRGSEMDDVIFGGSSGRPARNIAEVSVILDNAARTAPARYDSFAEIEVVRRIERGQGSIYRINGVETRARDVSLLFADAATGARSSGMVSQGRVGAIINARPADRRMLLEEAAGITGLHSRRHEAESRLAAASANLQRLDDVVGELSGRIDDLSKQARQAERYRTLSERIREAEAQHFYMEWLHALALIEAARARQAQSRERMDIRTAEVAAASRLQAEAQAVLPQLRRADSDAADALRSLIFQRDTLEAEAQRLDQSRADLESRLAQAQSDHEREASRAADAGKALERLDHEYRDLTALGHGWEARRDDAGRKVEAAQTAVAGSEADMSRLLEAVAAADAERAARLRRVNESEARADRARERLGKFRQTHTAAQSEGMDRALLNSAEMEVEAAQEYVEESQKALVAAEGQRTHWRAEADRCRDGRAQAAAHLSRLTAEADALVRVLDSQKRGNFPPVLDQVSAQTGCEAALAAALGQDLDASLDRAAPLRWQDLPPLASSPPLPGGVDSLARHVTAPLALARTLAAVGLAQDLDAALGLAADLAPGQRLVTRDGDLVRWDGLVAKAGAPSPVAVRLTSLNRLRELRAAIEDAKAGAEQAIAAAQAADTEALAAQTAEAKARDAVKRSEADVVKARAALAALAQRFASWETRVAALAEQMVAAQVDADEAEAQWRHAQAAVLELPADEAGRQRLDALRADLAGLRTALVEARSDMDRLTREEGERVRRLETIARDMDAWRERVAAAGKHLVELERRREELALERERLSALPKELQDRRADLLNRLTAAEGGRRQAADALMAGEAQAAEADRAARRHEAALAEAREDMIRDEAAGTGAAQMARDVASRIAERMDITPEQLRDQAGIDPANPPDAADLSRRLDRLVRERDAMGPVNLRAEMELAEVSERLQTLQTERRDLEGAIERLHRAIGDLNAEGRERLRASFNAVDSHFRDLFTRLFGGGRAHLAMVESDDPLQAGLEIMASPPGKRLQVLSLLSGGEQALTALALLFAVFMTNPAPICVLDEVDAPLDDANVDRFCTLVEGMAEETGTRFLIVTHHRMTMARMHRLYGVTMAERGVSQLVSVDLAQAVLVRDAGVISREGR